METWFIFSTLSIFALAGSEIFQKIALTHKVDVSAITNNFYVWLTQGTFGLLLVFLFNESNLQLNTEDILKLIIIGVVYFAGGTAYYTSFKGNSPSVSIILGSISVVISTLAGIIFLNESTTIYKFIGTILILFSILLLNINKKERISKHNLYALIGGSCFGIAFTIDKAFVLEFSPFIYLTLLCYSVALVSFVLKSKHIVNETKKLKTTNFQKVLLIGLFGTLFNLFTFLSYDNGGNVGVSDAMNNSAVFLIILFEIVILKDRTNIRKKILCSILAFVGISFFALT